MNYELHYSTSLGTIYSRRYKYLSSVRRFIKKNINYIDKYTIFDISKLDDNIIEIL